MKVFLKNISNEVKKIMIFNIWCIHMWALWMKILFYLKTSKYVLQIPMWSIDSCQGPLRVWKAAGSESLLNKIMSGNRNNMREVQLA